MSKNISEEAIEFLREEMHLSEFKQETKKVVCFETPNFHAVIVKERGNKISIYTEGCAKVLSSKYKLSKFLPVGLNAHSNIKANPSKLKVNTERCLFELDNINELKNFITEYNLLISCGFDDLVSKSLMDSSENRINRILTNKSKLIQKHVEVIQYNRNQDIVAEKLYQSQGICSDCNSPAPFLRKSDNTPYLEVHHIIPLSQGGEDSLDNTIALCPNCHRKRHFG